MEQKSIKNPHLKLGELLLWLERRAPRLQPFCRWLALDPQLTAAVLTPELARPPALADLLELARLLAREAPELEEIGGWLIERSEHCTAARVELQLDLLGAADADSWEHPIQILPHPRAPLDQLAAACAIRRAEARDPQQRQRLERVEAKLLRAAKIDARAARRRAAKAKMQGLTDRR